MLIHGVVNLLSIQAETDTTHQICFSGDLFIGWAVKLENLKDSSKSVLNVCGQLPNSLCKDLDNLFQSEPGLTVKTLSRVCLSIDHNSKFS